MSEEYLNVKSQVEPINPKTALTYSDVPFKGINESAESLTFDYNTSDVPFTHPTTGEQFSQVDVNAYNKYTPNIYPSLGEHYLNRQRAQNQSVGGQAINALGQAAIGEIVGGSIEAAGYLMDFESIGNLIAGTETEFGNWFSDIGKSIREGMDEAAPIYRDPDAKAFDPSDPSWWLSNAKTIASTLSLMIPSGIAVKGVGALAKGLGLVERLGPRATGIAQAVISRHMENMMEAAGVRDELYSEGVAKGMSDKDASEYAAKGAASTYKLDWAMLLQDIPQYMLLNMPYTKAVRGLEEKSIKAAKKLGTSTVPIMKSKAKAILSSMGGEGFEEAYQFVASEEGKYLARKWEDPLSTSSFDSRLSEYLKDGELWTSAVFGAIGGGVMQTAGRAINDYFQGGSPEVRFLKEFGSKISHAAQQVNIAAAMNSESGHATAVNELANVMFTKAASIGRMDTAIDFINNIDSLAEQEGNEYNFTKEDLDTLKLNKEQLLKDADTFKKAWDSNIKKHGTEKGPQLTSLEYRRDKLNENKIKYQERLSELEPTIAKFNDLSISAQDIFNLSTKAVATNKGIKFQENKLKDPNISPEEKDRITTLIDASNKRLDAIKKQIDLIKEEYTEEEKALDDTIDIGGPKNLLEAPEGTEVENNKITEYSKLAEAIEFADQALTNVNKDIKELLSKKKKKPSATKEKEQKDLEDEMRDVVPEVDDVVIFKKDNEVLRGIVDFVDENGDYHILYGDKLIQKAVVSKDNVTLDAKATFEEEGSDETISDEDGVPIEDTSKSEDNKYLSLSYMISSEDSSVPKITNEEFHKFIIDPTTDLTGVSAEFFVDTESEYGKKWMNTNKLVFSNLKKDSLTSNVIEDIPIGVRVVKAGKVLFEKGLYLHRVSFYSGTYATDIRKLRKTIIENIIDGNVVYTENIIKSGGFFNNSTERGNVIERHGLKLKEAKLGVSRKNHKVYISNGNLVPGVTSSTAGNLYANTKLTPDGTTMWAKVNPTKLTREHAEILWDAIKTRYHRGLGGYLAKFPDDRVEGLTVGEVINMLVLMGDRKTNPNHPDNKNMPKWLHNKALFVHSAKDLTFGTTTVNLHEFDDAADLRNKEAFIKWAMENKNYSVPLAHTKMSVSLNQPFKHSFKLGSWKHTLTDKNKDLTFAQILMSSPVDGKDKYAIVSDLQKVEGVESVIARPSVKLGNSMSDIKVRKGSAPIKVEPEIKKTIVKSPDTSKPIDKKNKVSSASDIIDLPVGAVIYRRMQVYDNTNKKLSETEYVNMPIGEIKYDSSLGRWLDLSRFNNKNTSDILSTVLYPSDHPEYRNTMAALDKFVSIATKYDFEVGIDLSNAVTTDNKPKPPKATNSPKKVDKKPKVEVKPKEESKQKEEPKKNPNSGDTWEDLNDIIGIPFGVEYETNKFNKINIDKELSWLYEMFGDIKTEQTRSLIRLASSGREAFSVFTADCIYVFEGAPEGAIYHEAFHRVLLGYLSPSDRYNVYKEARVKYNVPNATDYEVSELLAEEFRRYKLAGTKPKSRTVMQKFADLLDFIITFFTGSTRLKTYDIDRLFDSIDNGKFKYSKISEENKRLLKNIQVPMSVEIHRQTIPNINNYFTLEKIIKYLSSVLISVNNIEDLNNIKNISMSKMFEYLDSTNPEALGRIQRLESVIANTNDQLKKGLIPAEKIDAAKQALEVSTNLSSILKTVVSKEYRDLFVDKISNFLLKLNIRRIVDEDLIAPSMIVEDGYKIYDKASYEISTTDNILASVKFIIATLPKSDKIDPTIGVSEFVDFVDTWNTLLHRAIDINSTEEMMESLKKYESEPAYRKLISILEKDTNGYTKEQFRVALMKHRHDFINFMVKIRRDRETEKEGVRMSILSADVSRATQSLRKEWSWFFYTSPLYKEGLDIDVAALKKIYSQYSELEKTIAKEYAKTKVISNEEKAISDFTNLLNSIGIMVDTQSVKLYIENRIGDSEDRYDAIVQSISSDFSHLFGILDEPGSMENPKAIYSNEKFVLKLAEAYVNIHPEKVNDVVLGPSNNLHYVYSQNSYVSDRIRKMRKEEGYLEDHMSKLYSDNSYYMNQLMSDPKVLSAFGIKTFSMFSSFGSDGADYLNVNTIEDYLAKLTAFENGLIPFPTMADRKTFYFIKGIKPIDFEYTLDGEGNLILPEEVINVFVGYAKSEYKRIQEAKKVIADWKAIREQGDEVKLKNFEKNLVENYHYISRGKNKDENKAGALRFHHFPSLNDKMNDLLFDFERDIRQHIIDTINENIELEFKYAEDLGIISSYSRDKIYYYNNMIDVDVLSKHKDRFGSEDKAVRNIIAANFVRSAMTNIEIEKMFSGDPAFFKLDKDTDRTHEDKIKRLSRLTSTGDNFSETATSIPEDILEHNGQYNVSTIATSKFPSIYYDHMFNNYVRLEEKRLVNKYENDESITKEDILKEAKALVTKRLKSYTEVDQTDGQAWISPEMYRSLSIRLGEWSDDKQRAFDILQKDTIEEKDEAFLLNFTFQPLKLVYHGFVNISNMAVPVYDKASFATIFRAMVKGTYGNRQISEMLDRMERKGKYENSPEKIHMFKMDSATKTGVMAKTYFYDDNLEQINDISDIPVYQQNYADLKRQLVTDTHDVSNSKTGTQVIKMALANLQLNDSIYEINGENKTGREIANIAMSSLKALSNKGRQTLEEKIGYKDGRINKEKLIEMLKEDAELSGSSEDLIDALAVIGKSKELWLEIDSLTDHKWVQSRIISLVDKYSIDVKLPGKPLIQFSNYGIRSVNTEYNLEQELGTDNKHISWVKNATDDLKWITLENGKVVPMGCIVSINLFKHIIPNYDNITFEEKQKFIEANPTILGYRIPTQGPSSIAPMKVVGVYRDTIGDTITLPAEFTALTGSDFDIDKLYVLRYNYYSKKNGFEKVKFLEGDTTDTKFLESVYRSRYEKLHNIWKYVIEKTDPNELYLSKEIIASLNQIKNITDDIQIERNIDKLLQANVYNGFIYNSLNELIRYTNKDKFVEENRGKSIYEINSRKAVENRLLDVFFSIFENEAHYKDTSSPLGGLNKVLKDKSKIIRLSEETVQPDLYYASSRYNERMKFIYTGGKDGIGPFALNNVHHVLGQIANLKMKSTSFGILHEDTKGRIDLSKIYDKYDDSTTILNWLSALIDSHVDVAKDPYIMYLNVNSFTYNTVSLLIRGGLGEKTFDFIAQPILRELADVSMLSDEKRNILYKKLFIDSGRTDEEGLPIKNRVSATQFVKAKWLAMLKDNGIEEPKSVEPKVLFEGNNLEKDLVTDNSNTDFIERQLAVLELFNYFNSLGQNLNELIQASQIDTKKYGSTVIALKSFINRIKKVRKTDAFVDIDRILPFDPETMSEIYLPGGESNFLGTYANNSLKFSLELLGDISIYGTTVFNELFEKICFITGNTDYVDEKTANNISDEIFTALVSRFFTDKDKIGIDSKKLNVLFNSVMNGITKIKVNKDGKYTDLKENALLKHLVVYSINKEELDIPLESLLATPTKAAKDFNRDLLINSFKELFKDDRKEVRNLARRLFFYSYFTSGFRKRIFSFFDVMPNQLMHDITVVDPNDPKSMVLRSYNKHIIELLSDMKDPYNIVKYRDVIDEVIINTHFDNNINKPISIYRHINTFYNTFKGKKYDSAIALSIKPKTAFSLLLGYNDSDQYIFRPYIKVPSDSGNRLYRYIGYDTLPDGGISPIYVEMNVRGVKSHGLVISEYNMDKSIVPEYNERAIITEEIEEEFLTSEFTLPTYVPSSEQLVLKTVLENEVEEEDVDKTKRKRRFVNKIISGMQTGIDMLGLIIGRELDIETGGTTAPGFETEDGYNKKFAEEYGVKEISVTDQGNYTGSSRWKPRTKKNVADSDGTVYFSTSSDSAGLSATQTAARQLNKPFILNPTVEELRDWIIKHNIQVLNIAGNRGSRVTPEFSENARNVLIGALEAVENKQDEATQLSLFDDTILNTTPEINFYIGNIKPEPNVVFVFGSNPIGINGNPEKGTGGAALVAYKEFGVKQGEKMDNKLSDSGNAYGLTTVTYPGHKKSMTPAQIIDGIKKLYETANQNPNKQFKIAYRNTTDISLNGYTGLEMISMFNSAGEIPNNIAFSEEWKNTGKLINSKVSTLQFSSDEIFDMLKKTHTKEAVDIIDEFNLEYQEDIDKLSEEDRNRLFSIVNEKYKHCNL